MLSLKGARQISGNKVTMSILIEKNIECRAASVQRRNCRAFDSFDLLVLAQTPYELFDNFEQGALAVTRGRTGQ